MTDPKPLAAVPPRAQPSTVLSANGTEKLEVLFHSADDSDLAIQRDLDDLAGGCPACVVIE